MKAAALLLVLLAGPASAECGQALALGLDISGSVDAGEYRLQRNGLANALSSPAVRDALFDNPAEPARLMVYEWNGPTDQFIILPWTDIRDDQTLDTAVFTLRQAPRAGGSPTTAIGSALQFGLAQLNGQTDCARHTLDLSVDGESNTGPRPQEVARAFRLPDTIVNALAVTTPHAGVEKPAYLASYLRAFVIGGPGAFVEQAAGYGDYAAAMERKLLRELRSLALSELSPLPGQ